MIIIDNMSEKLLNNRLREIDKTKDNLLATVSHDLKTPINCSLMFIEKALNADSLEETKIYLKKIKKNIQL